MSRLISLMVMVAIGAYVGAVLGKAFPRESSRHYKPNTSMGVRG